MKRFVAPTIAVLTVMIFAGMLRGAENNPPGSASGGNVPPATQEPDRTYREHEESVAREAEQDGFTKWFAIGIDYTLASDYIFRGINFSESRRNRATGAGRNEGREALNHQLTTYAEIDLGRFGRVGGSVWFEFWADQNDDSIAANNELSDNKHLQEIDYTVYYGYTCEKLGLDTEVGFIWYLFPRLVGDGDTTQEIYGVLSWDDSMLWEAMGFDVDGPVLNPYFAAYFDLDLARGGSYYEFGMSHEFALADCFGDAPVLRNLTVTPSWLMAWHHNWLNKFTLDPANGLGDPNGLENESRGYASNTSNLMNMVYGLNVTYDLKGALGIPDEYCGAMYVSGFINYSHAIADHFLDDEFWGGMSVGYEW